MFDQSASLDSILSDRAKRARPADPQLYTHLPYTMEVADDVVRTRENALMASFEVTGIDGLTGDPRRIVVLRDQIARLLSGLDERFSFYIHRLTRPATLGTKKILGSSFAADVDRAWRAHLSGEHLLEFVTVVTVVRTAETGLRVPFFAKAAKRLFREDTETRLANLREVTGILKSAIGRPVRDLLISDGSLIGFYAALTNGVLAPEPRGALSLISEDAAVSGLEFDRGTIRIIDGPGAGRYAAVLYVSKLSQSTLPGMLDGLDCAANLIVTHAFTPIDRTVITERGLNRLAQMHAASELAGTIEGQLIEAVDDLKSGRLGFGEHQLTITVFAESQKALDAEVSRLRGLALQSDVRLERDRHATEASFFAMHPGNMDYRCRKATVSTNNFADLAALHMADEGLTSDKLPWATPITVFQTAQGSVHRFSFHEPGNPQDEPTVGHSLVLGPSGGGKTSTVGFLLAQAMRAKARIIVFDKDQGLKMAVDALGGRYAPIRAGQGTGLNPLLTETGDRGQAFLMDWLTALLERSGQGLTPIQATALQRAVAQNATAPEELRNFREFVSLIGDVNDDRALALKLAEWGPGSRYGWVFGPADRPVVDFSTHDVTALDLTELLDLSTERTAILSYLFRRIEMLMEEKRPTLLVIDEAWKVLDDQYFATRLKNWLVTARKQNVVVVMMTQFPSQILESRARAIFEGLPNQLIFANPAAEEADYDHLSLTENELEFVLTGNPARRMALWRNPRGGTLLDVDLGPLGPMLTVLGGGKAGQRAFGADYESRPQFWKTTDQE
ncbi:MAG: type IV secretion system protein B4 [Albidovulum sp.]|uniref:VirB4 family type IV secretion/conjugal transfer ATPase n=1 Tax=Albidovulum sp. TaxID=1872424 RepID=UPI003CB926DF